MTYSQTLARADLPPNAAGAIEDAWKLVGTWLQDDDLASPALIFIDNDADSIRIVRDPTLPPEDFGRQVLELTRSLKFDLALMVSRASVCGDCEVEGACMPEETVAIVASVSNDGLRELQMARLQNVNGVTTVGAITRMPMPVCLLDQIMAQRETVH